MKRRGGDGGEGSERVLVGTAKQLIVEMPQWENAVTCIDAAWLPLGGPERREMKREEEEGKEVSAHVVAHGSACGLVCVQVIDSFTPLLVAP